MRGESQEGRSHGSCRVGKGERWTGDAMSGHLQPFGLLILNHRSQCPHLWIDKCCFLRKGFIFLLFVLFLMFRLFFLRVFYFVKEISDVFGSKRASDWGKMCIYFKVFNNDVLIETWLYRQQGKKICKSKNLLMLSGLFKNKCDYSKSLVFAH